MRQQLSTMSQQKKTAQHQLKKLQYIIFTAIASLSTVTQHEKEASDIQTPQFELVSDILSNNIHYWKTLK